MDYCYICTDTFKSRNDNQSLCPSCELSYEAMLLKMSQKYNTEQLSNEMMNKYISINPAIRSSDPCISGTRLTVSDIVAIVFEGERDDYDYITDEQIDSAFIFYFKHYPKQIAFTA